MVPENALYYRIIMYRMKKCISKKEEGVKVFLIASMILVVIILAVGLILTISTANSMNKDYSSKKSFSNLLWIYVLSLPVIVILTLVSIFIFY
ncbi:hypothetical protein CSV75_12585 [Sporosarcina sp. P18a]|nr:hypothetical protein CSV75_12585 [Sporosarcina sp. P18a]